MKKYLLLPGLFLLAAFNISCSKEKMDYSAVSPSKKLKIDFKLNREGEATYQVFMNKKSIITPSKMQFEIENQANLGKNLEIIDFHKRELNESWTMPWGEQKEVQNHYEEIMIQLQEKSNPKRNLNIYFRAYNDGVAFRYEFPKQHSWDSLKITNERTQFQLTEDYTCWWIPGDWDIYEHLYNTSKFSEIDAIALRDHANLAQSMIPENAVNTPVTMRGKDGTHLSFHEANLTDYAGMTLKIDPEDLSMESNLVGSENTTYKVKRALPFSTPWRMISIGEKATDLLNSRLVLNLNEPNKLGNIEWFEPMKYMGIWWEMHLGIASWDMASGKHGATTENTKRYIDFAAQNNIKGLLVEGWNTGWEHWIGFEDREGVFDFVTPYSDYDLDEVIRYGREKGVELIMHHETSAAPRTYDQQLDTAFALMQAKGIHSVKTGYVGKIIPKGEYHHGQWMVNHYRRVLEKAAKYQVAINAHEPIKATGIRRTYPNAISREGLRGQEFNAWASDGGNPPEHLPIVAYTRMLAGPIDFTPGVFDILLKQKPNNRVNTTLAHQLALYVVLYSPIQMACDLPENYENHPAFEFIRQVGVDWDESIALDGEVGDFVCMARKEKNTDKWFVGCISDENERNVKLDFSFLDEAKTYEAIIYKDASDTDWKSNPGSYKIEKKKVNKDTNLEIRLAPGGGCAISLIPIK